MNLTHKNITYQPQPEEKQFEYFSCTKKKKEMKQTIHAVVSFSSSVISSEWPEQNIKLFVQQIMNIL